MAVRGVRDFHETNCLGIKFLKGYRIFESFENYSYQKFPATRYFVMCSLNAPDILTVQSFIGAYPRI